MVSLEEEFGTGRFAQVLGGPKEEQLDHRPGIRRRAFAAMKMLPGRQSQGWPIMRNQATKVDGVNRLIVEPVIACTDRAGVLIRLERRELQSRHGLPSHRQREHQSAQHGGHQLSRRTGTGTRRHRRASLAAFSVTRKRRARSHRQQCERFLPLAREPTYSKLSSLGLIESSPETRETAVDRTKISLAKAGAGKPSLRSRPRTKYCRGCLSTVCSSVNW